MGLSVRVIGLFYDKSEYKNELRLLKDAAQALAGTRDDLRVAIVTDKEVVKRCKEKFGVRWFDEHSMNTIVLEREPG
jgi:hypothetical protein